MVSLFILYNNMSSELLIQFLLFPIGAMLLFLQKLFNSTTEAVFCYKIKDFSCNWQISVLKEKNENFWGGKCRCEYFIGDKVNSRLKHFMKTGSTQGRM